MSLRLDKELFSLRRTANELERTSINGNKVETFSAKYLYRIIFAIISILLLFSINRGFGNGFVSFISSVLSIIVGLFITALIFSFDKFYEPNKDEYPSSSIRLFDTKAFNYTKKFAYLTSYTIVLSVFTLVLLSLSALFEEKMSLNLRSLVFDFENINWISLKLFIKGCIVFIQRYFVFYFLLKILYYTLYIVSSMVQYMTKKQEKSSKMPGGNL